MMSRRADAPSATPIAEPARRAPAAVTTPETSADSPTASDAERAARRWLILEKIVVTVIVGAVFAALFMAVDYQNARLAAAGHQFVEPATFIDQYIPFVPGFVWFYGLYYPGVFVVVFALKGREQFYRGFVAFLVLQVSATVAFVLFPTHMHRPDVLGNSLSEQFVRFFYHFDSGFNLFPSLHVAHTVLVALFYAAYKPKWFPLVATATGLVTLSTVLIKQHYFVDLPVGIFFAAASFQASGMVTQAFVRMQRAA